MIEDGHPLPRPTSSGRRSARSRATSTRAASTTSCPGWRLRSSRSASRRRLPLRRRDRRSRARGQATGPADPGPADARPGNPRPGGQGPDEDQGRASDDRHLSLRSLRGFVPNGEGIGVSRRLEDDERVPARHPQGDHSEKGGVIVRTAAEGASAEDVERDLVFLQRLWKSIRGAPRARGAGARLPGGGAAAARRPRSLHGRFRARRRRPRAHAQADRRLPQEDLAAHGRAVVRHREKTSLFEVSGVEDDIRSTLSRRVDLPSGGYLIFDYAEAFTVIDVNTGRFVGSRSKSSGARLEDDHEEQPRGRQGGRSPATAA